MENLQVVPAKYYWKRGFRNPRRGNLWRILNQNHVKNSMVSFKHSELFGSHVVFQALLIDPAHSNFIRNTL